MSEIEFINSLKSLIQPPHNLYPNALNFDDDICILGEFNGQTLIASQDTICENIHFFTDDPLDVIIKKAIRTNISDIACKGAKPYGLMLSLSLPKRYHNLASQKLILQALKDDLNYYNIPLLGGDTTSGETLTVSVTIFGLCQHKIPFRKNIRPNDNIYVTGTLGLAKIGLDLRLSVPQALSIIDNHDLYKQSYLLPNPPLKLGIALAPYMNASMDISDGLLGDLQKMINSTHIENIGFEIDYTKIPCADITDKSYALECALYGGDDYQILFTTNENPSTLLNIAKEYNFKLSYIGKTSNIKNNDYYLNFSHL